MEEIRAMRLRQQQQTADLTNEAESMVGDVLGALDHFDLHSDESEGALETEAERFVEGTYHQTDERTGDWFVESEEVYSSSPSASYLKAQQHTQNSTQLSPQQIRLQEQARHKAETDAMLQKIELERRQLQEEAAEAKRLRDEMEQQRAEFARLEAERKAEMQLHMQQQAERARIAAQYEAEQMRMQLEELKRMSHSIIVEMPIL